MISNYGPKTPDGLNSTGVVSIVNSSASPLGSAGVFTGEWEDVSGYESVSVAVFTDADGSLKIQFSSNGTDADSTVNIDIADSFDEIHRVSVTRKYFRVVLTNGIDAQSFLRLQSMKGLQQVLASPLNELIQQDSDSILTRSIPEESLIAEGKIDGEFIAHISGRNPDIDTGSVPEDVWSGGGVYTGFPTGSAETLTITSSSVNDAAAGTGLRTLRISGLDSNFELQTEDVIMNGSVGVNTVGTWKRVFSCTGLTVGSGGTNAGNITVTHTSTTANIFAYMVIGYGKTETAGYTIPAGYTGYLKNYESSILDLSSNFAQACIWYREFGLSVQLIRSFSTSSSYSLNDSIYGGISIPEKTDFIFRVTGVTNSNAIVSASCDLVLVRN